MSLSSRLIIFFCKLIILLIRILKIGEGSTWPGHIALFFDPQILRKFGSLPLTIIAVTGTNGKTTTSKLIETVLSTYTAEIVKNDSGANLENGIVTLIIKSCSYIGNISPKVFVIEIDEAVFSRVVLKINPKYIVLMNIFRDQLDRFGEIDAIAKSWKQTLVNVPRITQIIANADDPYVVDVVSGLPNKIEYFGLDEKKLYIDKIEHAADSIYCPQCNQKLTYGGVYFSHLGKWACGKCSFNHPSMSCTASGIKSPIEGTYNLYNVLASFCVGRKFGISDSQIQSSLNTFKPAFGRLENIRYQGKNIRILLSKNPTGFNESLRTVLKTLSGGPLIIVLNDREPDGKDVSWIWDVDFEMLDLAECGINRQDKREMIATGDRAYDLGVRLKYAELKRYHIKCVENLNDALEQAVQSASENEIVSVLPTYSGMLEVRKILTGKAIL